MTEYTHTHTHIYKQNQNSPTKIQYNRLTWWTKETKNYVYQLRAKLTKTKLKQGENWGIKQWNKNNKYVERKGEKEEKERIHMQS